MRNVLGQHRHDFQIDSATNHVRPKKKPVHYIRSIPSVVSHRRSHEKFPDISRLVFFLERVTFYSFWIAGS